MEVSAIEGFLELKPEGKKLKVMKKVKEIKDKFSKDGFIHYMDNGLLEEPGEEPVLNKFHKSTTMGSTKSSAAKG
jgi:hypothetical protein